MAARSVRDSRGRSTDRGPVDRPRLELRWPRTRAMPAGGPPRPHVGGREHRALTLAIERRKYQASRCRALLVVVGQGDGSLWGLADCLVLTGEIGLLSEDHYWIDRQ